MYKSNNVILIGFKGAGKTETARALSQDIGFHMADIDDVIEAIYTQMTGARLKYRDIEPAHGSAYFKQLERKAFQSIIGKNSLVIATAGNTPFDPEIRRMLRQLGHIVFLRQDPGIIYKKMTEKGIPHYLDPKDPKGSFEQFYDHGVSVFQNASDVILWVDGLSTVQAVEKIKKEIGHLLF